MRVKKSKGFSLIELLIVVAIILIIAAIAIPNLLRSRISANEASAVGSLRTINSAEIMYLTSYPNLGFTCNLTALGPPTGGNSAGSTAAGMIDSTLASGVKSGYNFVLSGCATAQNSTTVVSYQVTADPSAPGTTGQRYFCSDQSAIIKYDPASSANCLTSGNPI